MDSKIKLNLFSITFCVFIHISDICKAQLKPEITSKVASKYFIYDLKSTQARKRS